eukprot:gene21364-28303_t
MGSTSPTELTARIKANLFGLRPPEWPPSPAQNCTLCPNGTYSTRPDSTSCQLCPPGRYTKTAMAWNCSLCQPGTFSFSWGAASCRQCLAGTFSATNGSILCDPCPKGRTSYLRGSPDCPVDLKNPNRWRRDPGSEDAEEEEGPMDPGSEDAEEEEGAMVHILLTFKVVMNMSQASLASLSPWTTGINSSSMDILRLLIQADTEDVLGIPPRAVTVSDVRNMDDSTYQVGVTAWVSRSLGAISASSSAPGAEGGAAGGGAGRDGSGSESQAGSAGVKVSEEESTEDEDNDDNDKSAEDGDLSADGFVSKLTADDAFPRTTRSTGSQQRVVDFDDDGGQPNIQAIVWPTVIGTLALAAVMIHVWGRWRRRRGQISLLAVLKQGGCCCLDVIRVDGSEYTRWSHSSPRPDQSQDSGGGLQDSLALNQAELELHQLPGGYFAARFRINRNKAGSSPYQERGASQMATPWLEPGSVPSTAEGGLGQGTIGGAGTRDSGMGAGGSTQGVDFHAQGMSSPNPAFQMRPS